MEIRLFLADPFVRMGIIFYDYVKAVLVVDPFFVNSCKVKSVFSGFAKFRSLALLLNFGDD